MSHKNETTTEDEISVNLTGEAIVLGICLLLAGSCVACGLDDVAVAIDGLSKAVAAVAAGEGKP